MPNLLSLARIPLGAYFRRALTHPSGGATVLTLCWVTDVLDGLLARRSGTASALGSFIDSASDKVMAAEVVSALVTTHRLLPHEAALLFTREAGEAVVALSVAGHAPAPEVADGRHATAAGKLTTGLQYGTAIAATLGWRRATHALAWATAAAGVLAAVGYWQREHPAEPHGAPGARLQ